MICMLRTTSVVVWLWYLFPRRYIFAFELFNILSPSSRYEKNLFTIRQPTYTQLRPHARLNFYREEYWEVVELIKQAYVILEGGYDFLIWTRRSGNTILNQHFANLEPIRKYCRQSAITSTAEVYVFAVSMRLSFRKWGLYNQRRFIRIWREAKL